MDLSVVEAFQVKHLYGLAALLLLLAGCVSPGVRCDGRLERINAASSNQTPQHGHPQVVP